MCQIQYVAYLGGPRHTDFGCDGENIALAQLQAQRSQGFVLEISYDPINQPQPTGNAGVSDGFDGGGWLNHGVVSFNYLYMQILVKSKPQLFRQSLKLPPKTGSKPINPFLIMRRFCQGQEQ